MSTKSRRRRTVLAGALLLLASFGASAKAATGAAPPPAKPQNGLLRLDRLARPAADTPAGAVRAYVRECRREEWETAAAFLSLDDATREGLERRGATLAWQLKVVLDRQLPVSYERLSTSPDGDLEDGLPPDLDLLGRIGTTELLLAKSPTTGTWKLAAGSVEAIPGLYARYGYGALSSVLPASMFEVSVFDLQLWQWVALLLLAVLAFVPAWIGAMVLHRLARVLVKRLDRDIDPGIVAGLVRPLRLVLVALVFRTGIEALSLPVRAYALLGGLSTGLIVVSVTWLVLRGIDLGSGVLRDRLEAQGRRSAVAILPLVRRGLKFLLLALAFVAVLQNFGFNVTGLIAGLGIGGLALALAAQKSIANLFGGVSLVADQPIRVGDFCRFGDGRMGTVEEIGLRSTRIRTLDRTLITIPNADFSEIQLENYDARDRIRLYAVLGFRYETPPDRLRHLLVEMRKILIGHPMIDESPRRVRFIGFGPHSLDVEVVAYVKTSQWPRFLEVREDIYLRFLELVGESGTGFAFPSQTLYLGRDTGLDHEHGLAAEQRVRQWRERGELPFPDFPDDQARAMQGTTAWPPAGSSVTTSPD